MSASILPETTGIAEWHDLKGSPPHGPGPNGVNGRDVRHSWPIMEIVVNLGASPYLSIGGRLLEPGFRSVPFGTMAMLSPPNQNEERHEP